MIVQKSRKFSFGMISAESCRDFYLHLDLNMFLCYYMTPLHRKFWNGIQHKSETGESMD